MKCALASTVEIYTLAERAITSAIVPPLKSAVTRVIVMYPRSFYYFFILLVQNKNKNFVFSKLEYFFGH